MVQPAKRMGFPSAQLVLAIGLTGVLPIAARANWPQQDQGFAALRSGPGVTNHPIGVIPSSSVQIPQGWPLDAAGTMTCRTCHEKLPSLTGGSGPNLRGGNGFSGNSSVFCTNCHDDAEQRGTLGMHWMAIGRAHVKPTPGRDRHSFDVLDTASLRCLSCHDGVTAQETSHATAGGHGRGWLDGTAGNHPVGIRYATQRRGKGTRLRGRSTLPPEVRLPDGRVSCISCHNLYSDDAKLLSVPIEGSALCFSCHDMD